MKAEEVKEMDVSISTLRANMDEENDKVSDNNLSDVRLGEEYQEVCRTRENLRKGRELNLPRGRLNSLMTSW